MTIKAVLFDLDGTLTDTLDDISFAMNRALTMAGLPTFARDEYCYLVGNGVKVLAERAVRGKPKYLEQVMHAYQAYYEKHSLDKTRPYAGIPELLSILQQQGLKLCVLSNKPDADTKAVVKHFFPTIDFSVVAGQRPGIPTKPDPTAAIAISESLSLSPDCFLYLGDTSVDMTCAKAAGMHPIGVLWGFRTAEELRQSGAETLIATPIELLKVIPHK